MIKYARRPEGDGLKGREAVTTMATTFLGWRPSTLAAACVPTMPSLATAAQAHALGQPAVAINVRTAPTSGLAEFGAMKINNYMGTVAAAVTAEGVTESSLIPMNAAAVRVQKVQGDKVKGGDARGIPPRGRPV
jgi:hypothetical protein